MLHDPKHDITLQGLADWLATKSGPYDYIDGERCMLAQFYRAKGYPNARVDSYKVFKNGIPDTPFSKEWDAAVRAGEEFPPIFNTIAKNYERTFEAAYKRALDALAMQQLELV